MWPLPRNARYSRNCQHCGFHTDGGSEVMMRSGSAGLFPAHTARHTLQWLAPSCGSWSTTHELFQNRKSDLLHAGIRRHSSLFCFCRCGECRCILPHKLLHTYRPLPREREHVVRQPVETPRAMQIAHGRQVVYQVNRPAPLEQLLPPRSDGNVLINDRVAQRFRILLCKKMHVLGLRTGQVIDVADMRLWIGEQRHDHPRDVIPCHRRSLALPER
jgi:hypothetical protein